MSKKFLLEDGASHPEINIFADKSSLIIEWLLVYGINKKSISLREVERETGVSIGLVQKIFQNLVFHGYMKSVGIGTAKSFILLKPKTLFTKWTSVYRISRKCKSWSYSSAFEGRRELIEILGKSKFAKKVVRALHSAVSPYDCVNTNLKTLELYLPEPDIKDDIEKILYLEPKSRGYDVLLIQPYYKSMVCSSLNVGKSDEVIPYTKPLLTFLDLFNFPLRGREQAEHMAEKVEILRKIVRNKE